MQTENILKFLSYAGPRLDYLEKCASLRMEKQASAQMMEKKAINLVKIKQFLSSPEFAKRYPQFAANPSEFLKKHHRLATLSDEVINMPGPKGGKGTMQRVLSYNSPNKLGLEDYHAKVYSNSKKRPAFKHRLDQTMTSTTAKQLEENLANLGAGSSLWDDFVNSTAQFFKKNPWGAPTAAGLGGGALAGGLAYGAGSSAGQKAALDEANQFWRLQNAIDAQRNNQGFLSRLFG